MSASNPGPCAILALVIAGLWAGACDDDTLARPRADSGVSGADAGGDGPLPLRPGMQFTYQGILSYRAPQAGTEANSQFELVLTIESVDDRAGLGESTLSFTASGQAISNDDWDATMEFDAWIGRLSPSLLSDRVGATAVTLALQQAPGIPPSPTPKSLPVAWPFFVDVRAIAEIRAAFVEAQESRSPRVTEPSMNGGRWRFATSGPDETIFYFPEAQKTRTLAVQYSEIGFLYGIDETIGDTSARPHFVGRLDLVSGP